MRRTSGRDDPRASGLPPGIRTGRARVVRCEADPGQTETDEPRDIRNRAILMLLAIYGMRSGEVAPLRLDPIN